MTVVVPSTWRVMAEVMEERAHQIDSGRTPERDDRHSTQAWAWLLLRRASDLSIPDELGIATSDDARRLLIEVAAIAVAAVEALDRRAEAAGPGTP